MKALIVLLLSNLAILPKEISSVICGRKLPVLGVPANLHLKPEGKFEYKPKVGLDDSEQWAIGFIREIEKPTGNEYILTPIMAKVPEFNGHLGFIKLRKDGESAAHYQIIETGDPEVRLYYKKIEKSHVRRICFMPKLNLPETAATALPEHINSFSRQASSSSVHSNPLSTFSNSFSERIPEIHPR